MGHYISLAEYGELRTITNPNQFNVGDFVRVTLATGAIFQGRVSNKYVPKAGELNFELSDSETGLILGSFSFGVPNVNYLLVGTKEEAIGYAEQELIKARQDLLKAATEAEVSKAQEKKKSAEALLKQSKKTGTMTIALVGAALVAAYMFFRKK